MRGYLLIASFFASITVKAQDVMNLTVKDAVEYALRNNVNVKNAQLDVLIQEAQNAQATSAALPRVSAKGDYTDYVKKPVTFFPAEFGAAFDTTRVYPPGSFIPIALIPKYATGATLNASQTLFDGSVLVALQARNTILELAKQNGKLTEENVAYNVKRAYYSLAIAYRQFDIVKASLANFRSIAYEIEVLKENGFAEKIEVDRTNVQVNNLATDSLRINNLLTVSAQLLKYQMGMSIDQPIVLVDTTIEEYANDYQALLDNSTDYSKRTEFGLLQTQQRLNEYNLKRYRLAGLPTLSIFGNMGYNYATEQFDELFRFRKNYIFSSLYGLTLNVPIFNGFQRTNQVREAKLNIEKTKNNIDNIKLTIDFQSAQSRTVLTNSILQMQTQERNTKLANSVLDLAQRKYKEGVGSNLEVTQAQTDYLQAQNNYFQSLLDVMNAQVELEKALGLLFN